MALIFIGSTKCAICEHILEANDNVIGLAPISNREHRLYHYFDKGYHEQCFDQWCHREEALALVEAEKQKHKE